MSTNNIIIRHSNINDIAGLLPLLSQLGYPCKFEELQTRFIRFLNNPGYGVAVCEINGKILGLIAWSKSELFVLDRVRFHIEALVIEQESRGKGIGKKLMKFVESISENHKPVIIDLISGFRRAKEGTHEFYKNIGYRNEGEMAKLYLRKEL
jgi:GNAT superfamily N-acetyltransferase